MPCFMIGKHPEGAARLEMVFGEVRKTLFPPNLNFPFATVDFSVVNMTLTEVSPDKVIFKGSRKTSPADRIWDL